MGINKKGVNQKRYSYQKERVSLIEWSQPYGVKLKVRERKIRSGINFQGDLKKSGVKKRGVKQGPGVLASVTFKNEAKKKQASQV
jgi:hypothetical protein